MKIFINIIIISFFMNPLIYAGCAVTTTQDILFSDYDPFSVIANETIGSITMTCSAIVGLLNYSISMNNGSYGTVANRKMGFGSNRLNYNLYTNALRSQIWGDGTAGTTTVTGGCIIVLGACTKLINVYGSIAAGQNVLPGLYSDAVTVTMNY